MNSPPSTLTQGSAPAAGRLALAVTWEAKEGEAEAIAEVLGPRRDYTMLAEPGRFVVADCMTLLTGVVVQVA